MTIKINKATIIYFIIICSLAILFNIKTKNNKNPKESFTNNNDYDVDNINNDNDKNDSSSITESILQEFYMEELMNGKALFQEINKRNAMTYNEFEDLAINIKNKVNTLADDVLNDLLNDDLLIEDTKNYYDETYQTKLSLLEDNFIQYNIKKVELVKELEFTLSEKIAEYIENLPFNQGEIEVEGFQNILDTMNSNLSKQLKENEEAENNLRLKRKLSYFLRFIQSKDEDKTSAIIKSVNKSTKENFAASNSMFNHNQNNGLLSDELPRYTDKDYYFNPINSLNLIQDKVIGLLENNDNMDKKENQLMNNTNRGSLLKGLEWRDNILNEPVANLSYQVDLTETNEPKMLSSDFETRNILENKKSDLEEIKNRSYGGNLNSDKIEGFKADNKKRAGSKNNMKNLADGFIKYSSKYILGLLNINYNEIINNMSNETMMSYGFILIIVALFLFFLF